MSWLHARQEILKRADGWSPPEENVPMPVFCVLGPPGAGKSDALLAAVAQARSRGVRAAYLDLRHTGTGTADSTFAWICSQLKQQNWFPDNSGKEPRLEFVGSLLSAAQEQNGRKLLAIDHLESAPEDFVVEFVTDLRDYQERVDMESRARLLCVVSGSVSMANLRHLANSPNLQLRWETYPLWDRTSARLAVEDFLERTARQAEPRALVELTACTAGEPAFLRMLEEYLPKGQLRARQVTTAVTKLLAHAAHVPYLAAVAQLYWLHPELQRCVALLVSRCNADCENALLSWDIHVMQLWGALISQKESPYWCQFRNGIVERLFEGLHDERHGCKKRNPVDPQLFAGRDIVQLCQRARSVDEWLNGVRSVWNLVCRLPLEDASVEFLRGQPQVDREQTWFSVSAAVCSVRTFSSRTWIEVTLNARENWAVCLRLSLGHRFQPKVRDRLAAEAWLGFVDRNVDLAVTLYLASIGRASLGRELGQESQAQRRQVFVVYGRDSDRRAAAYEYLESLNLAPIDWTTAKSLTGHAMPTVFDVVDAGMSNAQACVVLVTGDDEAQLRIEFRRTYDERYESHLTPQARCNVIFEAGMALGRYRRRTIIVQFGEVRPFTDLGGFVIIRYRDDLQFREELRAALETAGCPADTKSGRWKTAGRFAIPALAAGAADTNAVGATCTEE